MNYLTWYIPGHFFIQNLLGKNILNFKNNRRYYLLSFSSKKTNNYHDKVYRFPKHFYWPLYYIVAANACAGTGNRNQYKKQFGLSMIN